MKKLTVLGSTGSIGVNTLDVVRRNRDRYQIYALAAGRNTELLERQIAEFHPEVVVVASPESRGPLRCDIPVLTGAEGLLEVVRPGEVDFVMSAIVGVAGLPATFEALRLGKRVGLANKEVLVSAGRLVIQQVEKSGAELIPVDSEHNGAHQCLRAGNRDAVSKLILTASGGPFRNTPREQLRYVTPEQALQHPTWRMGNRITVDSATLMNKGFEVIEACWLFGFSPAEVDVVVHPQSSVHAMVEFNDGSVLAQISATDMRMPIQYALTYPERAAAPVPKIDWSEARRWEFEPPDPQKFPLLDLAYQALEAGGSATCTLNAADEIAVEGFLQGRLSFTGIAELVEETLTRISNRQPATIEEVLEIDGESRALARDLLSLATV